MTEKVPTTRETLYVVLDCGPDVSDARDWTQAELSAAEDGLREHEQVRRWERDVEWTRRMNEAKARIAALEAEIGVDRAVCLCGCAEHENYGEDGESCENERHVCIRVSRGVRSLYATLESQRDELVRALEDAVARGCTYCFWSWPLHRNIPGTVWTHSYPEGYKGQRVEPTHCMMEAQRAALSRAKGSEGKATDA